MYSNKPLVSIHMITYNHEKFIEQAIESVITQKCDFNIELIITNDKSTDKTDEIIVNIINTHPHSNRIKYFSHKKNLGMVANYMFTLGKCQGKYIAFCEGDDYWTDPFKLQRQVNFLESNTSCIGFCHNFKTIDSNNNTLEESFINFQDKKNIDTYDIIAGASVATLTTVIRNIFNENPFPKITTKIGNLDTLIYAWVSTFGYFYADKQFNGAAYRKHSGGVWSMKPITYIVEQSILTHEAMLAILPAKYAGAVGRKLAAKRAILAVLIYKSNKKEFLEKYCLAVKTCFKYKAFKVFFSLHKKLVFK